VNLAACAGLPRTPENAVWYRATRIGYLPSALSSAHTAVARSRFNAGILLPAGRQYETLYFAGDHQTALFEFGAMVGNPSIPGAAVSNPAAAPVILNVAIVLRDVVDLSLPAAQISLATTAQELSGDWYGYQSRTMGTPPVPAPTGIAPTQDLGEALFRTAVEGFRSVSARIPYNRTLIVFPQNLKRGSSVVFSDGTGTVLRIDGNLPP
jgi:hypothetical protein